MQDAAQVRCHRTFFLLRGVCFTACMSHLVIVAGMAGSASAEPANGSAFKVAPSGRTIVEPLEQRFADVVTGEVPDFQKHVMPLLGRLGCNGRSCHGSFQGRGGFQLSLFGYDFKADHKALLEENAGRVDIADVAESLVLAKPVDADMHEGGKLLDEGTWQYNTLRRWIESGAKASQGDALTLQRLQVLPSELPFESDDQEVQLRAIAHWADGTSEEVTDLCRFASNDDAVAAIDKNGLVHSGLTGDTHVVVSYDRAVVPIPVTRAVQLDNPVTPPPASKHPIDQLIARKHEKLGIVASSICTDAEFIRRASLDITGTLPAAEDVRSFLADQSPDKRERLVNELLDAPGYAAWWATRMADWTGNSEQQLINVLPVRGTAGKLWFEWLRVRLDDNVPYDEIVEGIVMAESRQEGESYLDYCESMTKACQKGGEEIFAARDGMPLYWARRNFQKPEERAIGFAYAFLGVRIECAQCHKHPFDQWSKDDFEKFSKLFEGVNAKQNSIDPSNRELREELLTKVLGKPYDPKKINGGDLRRMIYTAVANGQTVPFSELTYTSRNAGAIKRAKAMKKKGKKVEVNIPEGYLLGAAEPLPLDQDPRGELMQWLRSPENPYFAKAIVNRVWSNYFGIGIINPTDDMNLANPASNEMLLEKLASEFVHQDYDLHWLHRMIVTSHAYQRSTEANASNQHDRTNFSRHVPRRLPAEVIRDAVMLATESQSTAEKMRTQLQEMSIAGDVAQNRNNKDFALQVFGQSERENNCDCDRSDSPSLLQSIYLRNDLDVYKRLDSKRGWVTQACKSLGHDGPGGLGLAAKSQDLQIRRKADEIRKQTIARVKRFMSFDEKQRARMIDKAEKQYAQTRKKFREYGFETPKFDDLIEAPNAWKLTEIERTGTDQKGHAVEDASLASVIEEAYLRTLTRYPADEEQQIALAYIDESETVADGLASLMWALVNTKEFIITH